jgi:hypothetical protein
LLLHVRVFPLRLLENRQARSTVRATQAR